MKKLIRSIVLGLLASLFIAMPVFADTIEGARQDFENYQGDEVILRAGDSATVRIMDSRGNWIADGMLRISNQKRECWGIYDDSVPYSGG